MKKIYKGFISYKEFHVELQLLIREEWELTAWVTEICGLLCYQMQQSVLIQCFPNRLFDRNSQQPQCEENRVSPGVGIAADESPSAC